MYVINIIQLFQQNVIIFTKMQLTCKHNLKTSCFFRYTQLITWTLVVLLWWNMWHSHHVMFNTVTWLAHVYTCKPNSLVPQLIIVCAPILRYDRWFYCLGISADFTIASSWTNCTCWTISINIRIVSWHVPALIFLKTILKIWRKLVIIIIFKELYNYSYYKLYIIGLHETCIKLTFLNHFKMRTDQYLILNWTKFILSNIYLTLLNIAIKLK